MAGIVSYGAYIPLHRLSRSEIARAWGTAPVPGEKAVASYDEDSLTMAVMAALDCLGGIDKTIIDGLYFASTTSPYREKQCAATIATILGLRENIWTMDFSNSLRCGSNAIKSALDAVNNQASKNILVCVAETRLGYPLGSGELSLGDGAGALLIGSNNTLADIVHSTTRFDEIQDVWRSDRDQFVRSAEDRFAQDEGYLFSMVEGISALLKQTSLKAGDFARMALHSPGLRQLQSLTQKLGFNKSQISEILHSLVGDTGSAMSIMSLIEALEKSQPGEKILFASYGNGCDAFVIQARDPVQQNSARRGIQKNLESRSLVSNYQKYLKWRDLIQVQPAQRPPLELRQPSPAAQWRESQWELRLTGTRCKNCGTPQYPKQRVCLNCQTKDQFEPYTFYDKPARVFSFSHDYVMQTVDPPVTVTIVDFEGGGRLMCDMTDRDPDKVKVGMPLEMTFRRLYYVGGIYNYWWKCQPLRA